MEKRGLSSVAVMGIIIKDQDSLHAFLQSDSCRDSDVVEDTKPHRAIRLRVMPRRTNNSVCILCFAVNHSTCTSSHAACSEESIIERGLSYIGGSIVNDSGRFFTANLFQLGNK